MKKQLFEPLDYGILVEDTEIIGELLKGQVVTVPTETVEGYAVALESEEGIRKLMQMKDRDFNSGKVFTLVPESKGAISKYVVVPKAAEVLINNYIPGELTLILPKNPDFYHFYYDHFKTVGIRIPDYDLFKTIGEVVGPVILTSANPRGGTPKSITGHKPSTIVDFSGDTPKIIRQGDLKLSEIN
ncbi:Sua5/YciO/YrdC/YwlC family protein [Candidatus Saccharibacteria bacterium]|nr:Sua5/YciO/YrdC/YwlC family protein [Candidatus Saccharibacteria bacterium]